MSEISTSQTITVRPLIRGQRILMQRIPIDDEPLDESIAEFYITIQSIPVAQQGDQTIMAPGGDFDLQGAKTVDEAFLLIEPTVQKAIQMRQGEFRASQMKIAVPSGLPMNGHLKHPGKEINRFR